MNKVDTAVYEKLVYLHDFIEKTERTTHPIDVNGIKLIIRAHVKDIKRKYEDAV